MKIVTIIGARPQFVKAAVVSKEIAKNDNIDEIIVHTGQHFDANMSDIFFDQMQIPRPKYNLNINSLSHGAMTGKMLEEIEKILLIEKPDWVLVYGDTNSTLAGALAAKKLKIKVAHVEAGLRSFNMDMPEEINRILTDRISDLLLCPTDSAIQNLKNEGFDHFKIKMSKTGDVMQDAVIQFSEFSIKPDFKVSDKFLLATIHRAENTDSILNLQSIFNTFNKLAKFQPIIIPLHPRTAQILKQSKDIVINKEIIIVEPLGYLQMLYLLKKCSMVLTDSGGLQKEAFFFSKPCITLREETEWIELVNYGVNIITGTNSDKILKAYDHFSSSKLNFNIDLYGNGQASKNIVNVLLDKN
jgi:UDP-GlcNAc3NAcA epimerase